jgi:hypothetical protein
MLIQILLLPLILIIIARLVWQWRHKKMGRRFFIFWLVVWLVAGAVIWRPGIASYFANKFGVGRGSDLAIYISIVLIFYLLFRLLMRLEKMEKQITNLVSQLAFDGREKKQD